MANKPKLDLEGAAKAESMDDVFEVDEIEQEIENTGEAYRELSARVYRVVTLEGGNAINEFCGKFFEFVDEQSIAQNFGAGRYTIVYNWKDKEGKRRSTTRRANIAREFGAPRVASTPDEKKPLQSAESAQNGGLNLGGLLGGFDAAKITAIVTAAKAIKEFLTPPPPPPPPQIDVVKLLEVMNAARANSAPSVSDAIVLKAMEMQKPDKPQKNLLEQLNELKQAKEIIKDSFEEEGENGGDNMKTIIKTGLQMLPMLLAANGNNYQAAGAAAKNIPMVTNLLSTDSELATDFINAVAQKYGDSAAEQLADGFGYTWEKQAAEQAQAAPQIENTGAETEQAAPQTKAG